MPDRMMASPILPKRFICSRCAYRSKACFSTTSKSRQRHDKLELPPIPPTSGYSRLVNRSLIAISGADSSSFLQGMVTQNMIVGKESAFTSRRSGSYSAFLNSQGRVLHDVFIYPITKNNLGGDNNTSTIGIDETSWLIEVDKNEASNLMKHLRKHKLRAKITTRVLEDDEYSVWAAWSESNESRWAAYNLESDIPSRSPSSSVIGCIDTRAPGFGMRYITPGSGDLQNHLPDDSRIQGSHEDLSTYKVRRILSGIAEGQQEIIRESALPIECNMDVARAIDFRKGCYIGQELTIRTHHTGIVRKRILPVQLYGIDQDAPASSFSSGLPVYDPNTNLPQPLTGTNISRADTQRGRSAGKFISGIGNIGLALCRLETMTDISLTGESNQYNPSQEFQMSWENPGSDSSSRSQNAVKVKAIVPAWLKEYILAKTMRSTSSERSNENIEGLRARNLVEKLEEEAEEK